MNRLLIATAVLALSGCVTTPKPLQGEFAAIGPREAVQQDLAGERVRWGGRLLELARFDTHTCFLVAGEPLADDARPYGRAVAQGRFLACRAGAYDPAVFAPGRQLTFTGTLAGVEVHEIGGGFRLPRVEADVVYLWPEPLGSARVNAPSPYTW
ncbi:Slp family lipoprotein [Arenimonas sp.]|uniref:Slp family lipoprotein n=1 Tax=Arenimonas sp. TaxID=1872635 RepID=UPI0025C1524E|nr:Slp family lipoprotein [Arenimonas sp.]